jgi:hypothetical protein
MTWPGLTRDVEHGLFMLHLSNTSKEQKVYQEYHDMA